MNKNDEDRNLKLELLLSEVCKELIFTVIFYYVTWFFAHSRFAWVISIRTFVKAHIWNNMKVIRSIFTALWNNPLYKEYWWICGGPLLVVTIFLWIFKRVRYRYVVPKPAKINIQAMSSFFHKELSGEMKIDDYIRMKDCATLHVVGAKNRFDKVFYLGRGGRQSFLSSVHDISENECNCMIELGKSILKYLPPDLNNQENESLYVYASDHEVILRMCDQSLILEKGRNLSVYIKDNKFNFTGNGERVFSICYE